MLGLFVVVFVGGASLAAGFVRGPVAKVAATRRWATAGFILGPASEGPTAEEMSNENVYKIVKDECTDEEVNGLVWKCLGYRALGDGSWDSEAVFPKWRAKYPEPPDIIGVRRIYLKEVDEPVLRANQGLVNSIPMKYKRGIRDHLDPIGFTGLKMEGLTPNKTRRAQCANWILYYREALHGLSIEELKAQKQRDAAGQSLKVARAPDPPSGAEP